MNRFLAEHVSSNVEHRAVTHPRCHCNILVFIKQLVPSNICLYMHWTYLTAVAFAKYHYGGVTASKHVLLWWKYQSMFQTHRRIRMLCLHYRRERRCYYGNGVILDQPSGNYDFSCTYNRAMPRISRYVLCLDETSNANPIPAKLLSQTLRVYGFSYPRTGNCAIVASADLRVSNNPAFHWHGHWKKEWKGTVSEPMHACVCIWNGLDFAVATNC